MNRTLLLVALVAATPSAWAQQPACRADGNQQEMNQCVLDALGKANAQLNATYAEVQASLKHKPLAYLRRQFLASSREDR